MSKQYAVLHSHKGKGSGAGLGNHIDRVEGKERTYPHADPERKNLNQELAEEKHTSVPLQEAIKNRISEGYNGNRKIRNDAIKYVDTILSGSHDQMKKIEQSEKLDDWIKENKEFAEKEFGKDNIIRFSVHLDEKTPHIHCVHVPLTQDGRLSAKEVIGNRKILQERQDRYAEKMSAYGLERGERNTGIKHENAKEYYKRVNYVEIEVDKLTEKGMFGVDKEKTLSNTKNALKSALMDLSKKEQQEKYLKNTTNNLSDRYKKAEEKTKLLKEDIIKMAKDPNYMRERMEKINERLKEKNKDEGLSKDRGLEMD